MKVSIELETTITCNKIIEIDPKTYDLIEGMNDLDASKLLVNFTRIEDWSPIEHNVELIDIDIVEE